MTPTLGSPINAGELNSMQVETSNTPASTRAPITGLVLLSAAAVLFLLNYVSAYSALIVLRIKEPGLPRPYRAFGFPYTTAIVLLGCVLVWIAAIMEDRWSAFFAGLMLVACAPVYAWVARRRRMDNAAG